MISQGLYLVSAYILSVPLEFGDVGVEVVARREIDDKERQGADSVYRYESDQHTTQNEGQHHFTSRQLCGLNRTKPRQTTGNPRYR